MSRDTRHDELPASNDPIWTEWAREVLAELQRPKTTEQLKRWARNERFEMGRLINALAWLDMRGLVEAEKSNGTALWRRTDPKPRVELQPVPDHCPRCRGKMKVEPERVACVHCGHSIYAPVEDRELVDAGDF